MSAEIKSCTSLQIARSPPTGVPSHVHDGSNGVTPENPPPSLYHSPGTGTSPASYPYRYTPSPLSVWYMNSLTGYLWSWTVGILFKPFFSTLVLRPTLLINPTRTSSSFYSLTGRGYASRPLSAYTRVASFCTYLSKLSVPASYLATILTQWRIHAPATVFNMVVDSRSPYVTPWSPWTRWCSSDPP